jgi:hypothetical protein
MWVLHECHKRSDLVDGKAKLAATANERQPLDIGIVI